jgi:hypothetical protein
MTNVYDHFTAPRDQKVVEDRPRAANVPTVLVNKRTESPNSRTGRKVLFHEAEASYLYVLISNLASRHRAGPCATVFIAK